jgi:predicted PurR-regulated permease PerM
METLSFTLGILSVIIVAFVAVLVWGIVKVVKQQKQINFLENYSHKEIETLHRYINESSGNMHTRLSEMDRNAYQMMQNHEQNITQQCKSYTDSRIDKLVDTYFEMKEINKKQLIKG